MSQTGTIILCDHVYATANGQYVIAGTYHHTRVVVPDMGRVHCSFAKGLTLYVRFIPEHGGQTRLDVRLKDEKRQVWDQSWLAMTCLIEVPASMPRMIEMPVVTPSFDIDLQSHSPTGDTQQIVLNNCIELSVDGNLVATTPFDVVFQQRRPETGEVRPPG